jgi:predicted alpha/beta superfamily hydrolase
VLEIRQLLQCLLAVVVLSVLGTGTLRAQDVAPLPFSIDRTEVRTVTSKSNGIAYKLYVALPHGYASGNGRFPVVYLLDADYSFLIARNIVDHLSERNHLREVIVVGIAYDGPLQYRLNRTRDYTPAFSPTGGYGPEMQKVSGGGPKFRAAIEKDIIPLIDRNYRTVPGDRCLVGHSYGGLFAAWNLLATPSLFQRYIVVSPSLWYRDRMIFPLLEEHAKTHGALPARVYFAVGAREGNSEHDMVVDLQQFSSRLRKRQYQGLFLETAVLDDETHNSVFPRALSNGLRFVFEGV